MSSLPGYDPFSEESLKEVFDMAPGEEELEEFAWEKDREEIDRKFCESQGIIAVEEWLNRQRSYRNE